LLRKLKLQIPGEHLAARYNLCQGPVPGRGPAVEKHWPTRHTTNTRDEYPCPERDSNPRIQQSKRLQTYALDPTATVIGHVAIWQSNIVI